MECDRTSNCRILKTVGKLNNLSIGFKQIIEKVFSDNQPLLRLDNISDNRNLFLTLVIAYVTALHASISPDSNPLAAYFHRTAACQDMFILMADAPIIAAYKIQ
ncbi:e3 ubiquitin-protein ligase [Gigaspora margarita]|uniref:E3 ubiquitin-protein ligase n=1 Tax=Gigaspora margarita TaxID=4874 RepID=A0A8H4ETG8_GIGMA|nr:e3 ubiquitin-protein ligase [Gigaspora margarita]